MNQIVKLDDQLINQIAAGEVIENPASVVKELLDNSIDSGASRIHIKIEQGGKEYLSIEDNGCGMTKANLELSIERHATSKISKKEDLFSLKTMGFRGEALASIAAISKMEIISSREAVAHKLSIQGGKNLSIEPSKRGQGTTIIVQSLFYNVPVRKKFQKSTSFCTREVIHAVQMQALSHPNLYISIEMEDKTLNYMPANSRKNRIADVLGKHFVKGSFSVGLNEGPFKIEGIISNPLHYKTHRRSQYLFINNRPVICPYLAVAVREGYGTFLAEKTFPLFALFITLPEEDVDINVHPQKKEVRLLDERGLFKKVEEAVFHALSQEAFSHDICVDTIVETKSDQDSSNVSTIDNDQELVTIFDEKIITEKSASFSVDKTLLEGLENKKEDSISSVSISRNSFSLSQPYQLNIDKNLYEKQAEYVSKKQQSFSFEKEKDFAICYKKGHLMLVQEAELFLIGNQENRLVLIDLQAAYAQVLFQNSNSEKTKASQKLFLTKTIELSQDEMTLVDEHESLFKDLGIEFRVLGDTTIAIDSFIPYISYEKIELFFKNLIDQLFLKGKVKQNQSRDSLRARICCQIARKRTMFSDEEAKKMIKRLIQKKEHTFDPLGSKILSFINEKDLERFLKI